MDTTDKSPGYLKPQDLSYASLYRRKPLNYGFIKLMEILFARRFVYKHYKNYLETRDDSRTFWDQMITLSGLKIEYDPTRLDMIPKTGPVVIVANHPFGVIDGFVISYLTSLARKDYKVITDSVLTRAPEVADSLIAVKFDGSKGSLEHNLKARKEALHILKNNGCIVVFPAGRVMTTESMFSKQAYDADWQPFVGKLIQSTKATVVPMFFEGQNSRLFQIASHLSITLRSSLFLNELRKHIKQGRVNVIIGDPVDFETHLSVFKDRKSLMRHLQNITFALGGIDHSNVRLTLDFSKDFNMNPYTAQKKDRLLARY